MSLESRPQSKKKYLSDVQRDGPKLSKQYVGALSDPMVAYIYDFRCWRKATEQANQRAALAELKQLRAWQVPIAQLATWSSQWRSLRYLLQELGTTKMQPTPQPSESAAEAPPEPNPLPPLQTLQRACRRAQAGDTAAQQTVSQWLQQAPGVLDFGLHLLQMGRARLEENLATVSAQSRACILESIDNDMDRVANLLPSDDPLRRSCAECFVLAKMHLLYCQAKLLEPGATRMLKRHYEELADRAQRRCERILQAYNRQVGQGNKRKPTSRPAE